MWWDSGGNPLVTMPGGFTLLIDVSVTAGSGIHKLKVFWKRLAGADTGNYTFSWSGGQWNSGQAILVTGGKQSGDPIGADYNTALGTSTNEPVTTVTTSFKSFLAHFVTNENGGNQTTPPIGFTEVQDANALKTNYRIPGAAGLQTASGGVLSVSTHQIVALVAIQPEPDPRWFKGDGTVLKPYLKTSGGLAELE